MDHRNQLTTMIQNKVQPKLCAYFMVSIVPVLAWYSQLQTNFTYILQDGFTGTGAITRLPQCQWCNPEGFGSTNHRIQLKTLIQNQTVCIFHGPHCTCAALDILPVSTNNNDLMPCRLFPSMFACHLDAAPSPRCVLTGGEILGRKRGSTWPQWNLPPCPIILLDTRNRCNEGLFAGGISKSTS